MAFKMFGRKISKVGIVGSGQIGPDIALHFRQVLLAFDVPVVVVDVAEKALEQGRKRCEKKIGKLTDKGRMKPEKAQALLGGMTWTTDYAGIEGADLIVEAATENPEIKHKIFKAIEEKASRTGLLLSNSSHMEPEAIYDEIADRSRCAVTHYFFPAERNPIVEVIPGKDTSRETTDFLLRFYEAVGKVPIEVQSRYGYAIDPIFEGLFEAAALCVEEGLGTVREVDFAAQKGLKMGVGPFTAHNLTGGNPLTHHGLMNMTAKIGPWFKVPKLLKNAIDEGRSWGTAQRGEKVEIDPGKQQAITDEMMGAYFGIVCEILESGISNVADMEMAVGMALAMMPPFTYMNKVGVSKALTLVEAYAKKHPDFVVSDVLRNQASSGEPWKIPLVIRRDEGDVAVVTIRRPAVLNALNDEVIRQVGEVFGQIKTDEAIKGAVVTGFGTRAFVAGADITELASLETEEQAYEKSLSGHGSALAIENLGKPVVAALNGLAFGGGNELAMACNARIAVDTKMLVGQPEPKLGIIPGFGGTQRLPRWVGLKNAWKILRDGEPISSAEALEIGLVREIVKADARGAAILLVRDMISGKVETPRIPTDPIDVPDDLPDVDIGHLSTKIDGIMQEAIINGAKTTLAKGLEIEARCFGKCLTADDMRIGMKNFIENGPRAKAEFKNS
ncbi:MAG: enoyl-CoA hydratase/isomerase family protein [Deltaproteobacteria bacterium]|nr:enoyl-CoA hydratase/isomerase family protein [Deltaproteobacteria bacterium]